VLRELVAEGVIEGGDYDPARVRRSTTKFLKGQGQQEPHSTTVEYVFSLLRALGGVEVASAGVRINIHRSGAVSALRLGGASAEAVDADDASNSAPLAGLPIGWSKEQASIRFAKDFPRARKVWDAMMYVVPDELDGAVIAPRYVFSFSNQTSSAEGDVVARRRMVGYSVTSLNAAPEELGTKPESSAPSTVVP
jgi:hypothetical protein